MERRPIVFIGPSLARSEARTILEADYRPPIRTGDLDAVPGGAIVAVIDGVLDPELRLPLCEAVRAMDRGVRLFGAASSGALLGAALGDPRFVGLGRVFDLVARYPDAADDLVAVLYVEHDNVLLTEPLVNAVLSYIDHGDAGPVERVIRELRLIPIEKRTEKALKSCLHALATSAGHSFGPTPFTNYKAEDARLLLRFLAEELPHGRLVHRP